jgi:hypothetical protein
MSEPGDKTSFFIAAFLAMKVGKGYAFLSTAALTK